jgi:transposase
MVIVDKYGLPVSAHCCSASPGEVTLVEETIARRFTQDVPEHLIGDKAYDSDPLDKSLAEIGTEMISPHRSNRVSKPTQDGRALRRYSRRWQVERFNAWIQNYRKVLVRWDRKIENYRGFVLLACAIILGKRL